MENKIYDIIILGAGISGVMAAYKLSLDMPSNTKALLIDYGRPPGKRRKQLEGWLGCLPNSNTRLYQSDYEIVKSVIGQANAKKAMNCIYSVFEEFGDMEISNNKEPSASVQKRLTKNGYSYTLNNYIQWKPENVHKMSRGITAFIEEAGIVDYSFDNLVISMDYNDKTKDFTIVTEEGTFITKKLLLNFGRSGWRFVNDFCKTLGLVKSDNFTTFGFKAELPISYMKDWNESHCTLNKKNLTIGPISWHGTVIPEDHSDLVISAWRSNEDRWYSDKVSFSVMSTLKFKDEGLKQVERLGKLAYILLDNRVNKSRVKEFIKKHLDICLVPEYNWFTEQMKEIDLIIPQFTDKAYFYLPDIFTTIPNIKINKNLSTDINGLFLSGESAGIKGIMAAAASGFHAASRIIA